MTAQEGRDILATLDGVHTSWFVSLTDIILLKRAIIQLVRALRPELK